MTAMHPRAIDIEAHAWATLATPETSPTPGSPGGKGRPLAATVAPPAIPPAPEADRAAACDKKNSTRFERWRSGQTHLWS